ncbi:hypothetical protein LXL04_006854 [Taraxacum kok-saghyz]
MLLLKLLPNKWVTNYEQIHQAPVQSTTAPDFIRHANGQVEVKFSTHDSPQNHNIFPTVHMIQPTKLTLPNSDNHCWFDVCNCSDCLDDAFYVKYGEVLPRKQHDLEELYDIGDPSVGHLGDPSGKFDYYVCYKDSSPEPDPCPQHKALSPYLQQALSIIHKEQESSSISSTLSCYVISSDPTTSTYQTDFPPLSSFENPQQRTKHDWKIKNPTTLTSTGSPTSISHAEATLNWQSENVVAQNRVLSQILSQQSLISKSHETIFSKVKTLEDLITEIRLKLNRLHNDLLQTAKDSTFTQESTVLSQKEAEMMTLKNQLVELERQDKLRRTTDMIGDPWKLTATPFVPVAFEPQPFPQTLSQTTSPSLSLSSHEQQNIRQLTKFTPEASRSPTFPVDSSPHDVSSDVSASSKAPTVFPISPCLPNPLSSFLSSLTMTDNSPSPLTFAPILNPQSPQYSDDLDPVDTFEHLFMTEDSGIHVEHPDEMDSNYSPKPNQPPDKAFPRSDSKIFFTFDDIGPSKWRDRSFEMLSWMIAELQFYSIDMVIKRFLSRLQGRLRDWYNSLGEYRQLTIQQCETPEAFMSLIQIEFVDLETHYNRMSQRFYCLQGIDDVNLKGVFLNSFPESLANEIKRFLDDRNATITQTTLDELYQLILNALTKLCNHQKFKMEFKKVGNPLGAACDEKHFKIKCKDQSSCDCRHTKKTSHFKKISETETFKPRQGFQQRNPRDKKKWKFVRKKQTRGRTSDRCFNCQKKGHFARDCPDKKKSTSLIQALHQIEPVDISDIESLYSLDDEPTDEAILSLPYLDYSSDEDSDPYQPRSSVFMINPVPPNVENPPIFENPHSLGIQPYPRHTTNPRPIPHLLPIQRTQPMPLAKVHLLTDVYAKPIPVIAFFDTGSSVSIIDPNILPARFWKPHYQTFYAANGQTFVVNKISIPINIRLFPRCVIRHRFLECNSVAKDVLIGFDLILKLPDMRFLLTGLRYKSFFNPYSHVQRVCMTTPVSIDTIRQSVIESTTSPWACEAFYVNKRNEQTRGKLRLVINYQPSNHFLADDKFPLPQKKSLFQSLVNAKVMSKFDLKSGFWKLGIQPRDRSKTAFCVPNHHFQWKVMPFGLKNAPSTFQKAMIRIFEPILENTLIYIDDILLFSPDESSHMVLLSKFHDLVRKYGIMLSESKMEVGVSSIEFLGMKISDGKYQPQPHIAKELVHFPDELRSQKKIHSHCLIPSATDKRILQTDASDDYWGAVLLVEDSSSVRSICGYKSGTFKASEQHYHSTFKEILAVKRGIEKFQFHLIGHEFHIEMDMASFPRMIQFKQKMLPEAQLLRWANWFSQWKFTVKHIKGTDNVLADFLSRPRAYKSKAIPSPSSRPIKMVHLIEIEENFGSSSAELPPSQAPFPTIEEQIANLPNHIKEAIADITLPRRALLNYKIFLTILLQKHGEFMKGLRFHPDYPFLNVFHIHDLFRLPKEALVFFWYLFEAHTIAISFNASKLANQLATVQKKYVVIMFRRPVTYHTEETLRQNQPQLYHSPLSFIHEWSDVNPIDDLCILKNSSMYFRLRRCLAHANRVDPATIPTDIMHELTSWSDSDLVSSHWIQALEEWKRTHLQPHIDTSDDDIDSDAESGYYIEYDEPHFDRYEDDPSHEDSRWK